MGGLVVLVTTGKNPLETYKAIFEGSGLNWLFPWVTGEERVLAGFNLQQTLIATTTLILVGLAVAFAFRCGLFNIGGQGQYLSGAILAVWVGSSFEGMTPVLHIVLAIVVGTAMGALIGGIAGFLKATVGAHEVISTIMLNWTVLWVGVFLFGLGGPLQNDLQESVPISNDILESAKLQGLLGRRAPAGAPHRVLHRARRARRLLDHPQPDDARVRRQGGRLQPGGGALRRHQRRAQLLPRDGDLGRVRRARRARSTSSAGSSGCRPVTSRRPRSASRGSRSRCSDGTPPSGSGLAALLFGALVHRHVDPQPRPGGLPAGARVEPDPADPGARRPLRRAWTWSSSGSSAASAGGRWRRHDERRAPDRPGRRLPAHARMGRDRPRARVRVRRASPDLGALVGAEPVPGAARAARRRLRRSRAARSASGGTRSPPRCSASASPTSRRAPGSGSSRPSSSGRRCSPRCSASRRR